MPSLSARERSAILAALQVCEKYLAGDLQPRIKEQDSPDTAEIVNLDPEGYFRWFDNAIFTSSRKELQAIMKAWVAAQAGGHASDDLPGEDALARKQVIARGIQQRLNQVGLVIRCQHIGKSTPSPCGAKGKLNAMKSGNSRSGQFLVIHPGDAGKTSMHMMSSNFPKLRIAMKN